MRFYFVGIKIVTKKVNHSKLCLRTYYNNYI